MSKSKTHKSQVSGAASRYTLRPVTLGDLLELVGADPAIPKRQREEELSAIRVVGRLLGNGAQDLRLDPKSLLARLDELSPAAANLEPGSLANLKSRFRRALRRAQPLLASARSLTRLHGDWVTLEARLPRPLQAQLSRLLRFCQDNDIPPEQIGEAVIAAFERYLADIAMLAEAAKIGRATRKAWNRAHDTLADWPGQRVVVPPPPKRIPYWLRSDQLPASLAQEIEAYLERLAQPDPFLGATRKPPAPGTIQQYRYAITTLVSHLVLAGVPLASLTSLGCVVGPGPLRLALQRMHQHFGERVTPMLKGSARRARTMAHDLGLPEAELAEIDALIAAVERVAPANRSIAPKNRRLLEALDVPGFIDRLLHLPSTLVATARTTRHPKDAAACARDAVAVELLLTCSMRVGNLADLRLGDTIRKLGDDKTGRWVIDIPGERVKNGQALRFTLLPESIRLLEWYVAGYHAHWAGPASLWLFPSRNGSHLAAVDLSQSIAQRALRHVGIRITAHQFRHLAAELVLREDPNALGIVSQHLGHRDLAMTRTFYAREQTRIATRHYQEVLERARAAPQAPHRRRRPVTAGEPA